MAKLSDVYNVVVNLRGMAAKGCTRPTIKQFFTSNPDFECGAQYQDPVFLTRILSPNTESGDNLGASLAMYGTKVVVGASEGEGGAGTVYIFNTDGTYIATLVAPDAAAGDLFGSSVAISANACAPFSSLA